MADLSKTLWSRRSIAVVALGAAVVLTACGGSSSKTGDKSTTSLTTAGSTTTVDGSSSSGSGTPSRKPCDLLTKEIAEAALGVAVGAPTQAPGQGNETCNYRATGTSSIAMVYLTTYAVKGTEAGLDAAATQFKNAYAVDGVGDSARQPRRPRHRRLEG